MHEILRQLVEFPTVSGDYTANNQAIEYIDQFLNGRGMHVKRLEFNDFESLVATTRRTKRPELFLVAHLDVVPAGESMFTLTEKDGKFYGRGVFDMKFAIAAYLHLVDALRDELGDYDFGIMITTDEEIGGYNGVKKLIEAGYIPKACVIPDGGSNWAVETFAKGISWLNITAHGKSTHSSRPWEGENAFEKLTEILGEIKRFFPEQNPGSSTLTIARVHSGKATNQVPDTAEAQLDIRFASREEQEEVTEAIKTICRNYGADLAIPVADPPCNNDPRNPYIARFMQDIEAVIGYPTSTTVALATSDARFFATANVPCAITYPPGGGHHGPDEWLDTKGFEDFYEVIRRYTKHVAVVKAQGLLASANN